MSKFKEFNKIQSKIDQLATLFYKIKSVEKYPKHNTESLCYENKYDYLFNIDYLKEIKEKERLAYLNKHDYLFDHDFNGEWNKINTERIKKDLQYLSWCSEKLNYAKNNCEFDKAHLKDVRHYSPILNNGLEKYLINTRQVIEELAKTHKCFEFQKELVQQTKQFQTEITYENYIKMNLVCEASKEMMLKAQEYEEELLRIESEENQMKLQSDVGYCLLSTLLQSRSNPEVDEEVKEVINWKIKQTMDKKGDLDEIKEQLYKLSLRYPDGTLYYWIASAKFELELLVKEQEEKKREELRAEEEGRRKAKEESLKMQKEAELARLARIEEEEREKERQLKLEEARNKKYEFISNSFQIAIISIFLSLCAYWYFTHKRR